MSKENHILLSRVTLTSDVSSVTFNSIPQTGYTDLKIVISGRTNRAGYPADGIALSFNGLTTGFSGRNVYGQGSSASSVTDAVIYGGANGAQSDTNVFSSVEIYIPNYTSSSNKTVSADAANEFNNTVNVAFMSLSSILWSNTAAISSIGFQSSTGSSFVAGSSFSLYGIADANTTPTISPKAFGGDIVRTDGTYWYHAFLSSGLFTAPSDISADVLVVGGGGGGSNSGGIGSGGGAGAINYQSSISIASGSYNAVVVGAGGARDNTSVGDGQSGSQSSFGSIIANVANKAKGSNSSSGRVGGDGGNTLRRTNLISFPYIGGLGAASSYPRRGGSGAGATSDGSSSYPAIGGNGSNAWSSWATATGTGSAGYYAGGGAGGYEYNGSMSRTAGGLGGGGMGGAGTSNPNYNATDGTANTGGGGGGCGGQSGVIGGLSGNGGSGIVIVRYLV